jgi:hypothetical protein
MRRDGYTCIAGILNMSGARRLFDELLNKYNGDGANIPTAILARARDIDGGNFNEWCFY